MIIIIIIKIEQKFSVMKKKKIKKKRSIKIDCKQWCITSGMKKKDQRQRKILLTHKSLERERERIVEG